MIQPGCPPIWGGIPLPAMGMLLRTPSFGRSGLTTWVMAREIVYSSNGSWSGSSCGSDCLRSRQLTEMPK